MMIVHASIPSGNPQRAAHVLADILQGEAYRFPPGGPEAWLAFSGDGQIEIEVIRRGRTLIYREEPTSWSESLPDRQSSECHLAICVDRPAAEVIAIAQAAGWPARSCIRGGGLFQLSEVWVDALFMLEFMDPPETARYREVVTPTAWRRSLALAEKR